MTDISNKINQQLQAVNVEQDPVNALDACLNALSGITYAFLTGEPVASIESGQIKPDEQGRYIKAAISWFKDWMQLNNHGQEFENEELGTVIIAPSGIKAAMSHKPHPIDVQALAALPLVIEKAKVLSKTMDDDGKNIENTVIAAPIEIDGEKSFIVIRLRRNLDNRVEKPRFYTQAVAIAKDIKKGYVPSDQVPGRNKSLTQHGGRTRLLNVLYQALNVNNSGSTVVTKGEQYQLPVLDESNTTSWGKNSYIGDDWRGSRGRDFQPNARQQIVIDATKQALDEGLFYNDRVNDRVAELLNVSHELQAINYTHVDGGDFGYDVYHARHYVEAQQGYLAEQHAQERLNLSVGQSLGTLIFSGKQYRAIKVEALENNQVTLLVTLGNQKGIVRTSYGAVERAMAQRENTKSNNLFDNADIFHETLKNCLEQSDAVTQKILLLTRIFYANEWSKEKRYNGFMHDPYSSRKLRFCLSDAKDNFYIEVKDSDDSFVAEVGNCKDKNIESIISFINEFLDEDHPVLIDKAGFDSFYTEADVLRHYHLRSDIDKQAHAAATSPYNDLPEPTEEQKSSGDYLKGEIKLLGLDIHIENPAGSTRTGTDEQGSIWANKMAHHYGYFADTLGADGDEVDVFVKSGCSSDFDGSVFVIDQINPDSSFDEHKVVLGAANEQEARDIYLSNYEKDWMGLGGITEFNNDDFKDWLFSDKAQVSILFDSISTDLLNQIDVDTDPVGALTLCLKILTKDQAIGEFSDNHNDENYRYKDVGYIPNSRKELAQSSILQAKKDGNQLCVTDIDWDGLESEPRIAESLITKQNVFGKVDWHSLKDQGMNGNVAYLLKRLYTAIEKQPVDHTAEARRLYVTGIQNLRSMMEQAKTYDDVRLATINLSQLLKPGMNIITDETGAKDISYDCKVMLALGKKLHSWIFKSGNKALHECKKMAADDWTWLEGKPQEEGKPKTTRKERFQLEVASEIQRIGGQPVSIESTEQFKNLFGLAAVQSGKWVLSDTESAAWHITNAAASFMDMSDVTGIPVEQLGFGGRLGMAFGARGHGGALAHYEPDTRAINITKMRGGGSLGHEYFHFLDNVINEVMGQSNISIGSYGTRQPEALPDSTVRSAFEQLKNAMFDGNEVVVQYYPYGEREINWAKRNMESTYGSMAHHVKAASSLKDAAQAIDQAYRVKNGAKRPTNADSWIKIAAIYFNQYEGKEALIPTTRRGSSFYIKALDLDQQKVDSYWSSSHEMAARSFSAYLQDRLAEQQRQNDYLAYSTQGGNSRVGEVAYPQGEERQRVNSAFDALFKALRDEDVFGKAMSNQALMDSIFGLDEKDLELLYLS